VGLLLGAPRAGDIDRPIIRPPHAAATGLMLWARHAGDRQRRPPGAQQHGAQQHSFQQ